MIPKGTAVPDVPREESHLEDADGVFRTVEAEQKVRLLNTCWAKLSRYNSLILALSYIYMIYIYI